MVFQELVEARFELLKTAQQTTVLIETQFQPLWFNTSVWMLKGIVHPKMKILSSFTHPQVVPNLYECLCSAEHKGRYSEECGKQSSSGAPLTSIVFFFPTMEVNGAPKQPGYKLSSKYLPLCSAEQRHSYRFETTWGWVNDDRIFIFGWTIPLSVFWIRIRPAGKPQCTTLPSDGFNIL